MHTACIHIHAEYICVTANVKNWVKCIFSSYYDNTKNWTFYKGLNIILAVFGKCDE